MTPPPPQQVGGGGGGRGWWWLDRYLYCLATDFAIVLATTAVRLPVLLTFFATNLTLTLVQLRTGFHMVSGQMITHVGGELSACQEMVSDLRSRD